MKSKDWVRTLSYLALCSIFLLSKFKCVCIFFFQTHFHTFNTDINNYKTFFTTNFNFSIKIQSPFDKIFINTHVLIKKIVLLNVDYWARASRTICDIVNKFTLLIESIVCLYIYDWAWQFTVKNLKYKNKKRTKYKT